MVGLEFTWDIARYGVGIAKEIMDGVNVFI